MRVKASLFLILGLLASALLMADCRNWKAASLFAIAIWSFCRLYYFAFYVIERYIDPDYRFSGLSSALREVIRSRAVTRR